jgi:hypothetical protein
MKNSIRHSVKLLVLAAALMGGFTVSALAAPAASADTPVLAVLSLIGDRLDIVIRQYQTGTHLDPNRHETLPISEPVFDDAAITAAGNAIRRVIPKAEIAALRTRSQVLFDKQATLFEVDGDKMAIPDAVKDSLREQGATKLVLVGKRRDDASFKFADGTYDGAGKLQGLGFYLDGTWETRHVDAKTGARSQAGKGFIVAFAFLEVTLVDLPSCHVVGKKKAAGYFMAGSGRAEQDIGEPWRALTSAEKVRFINQIIQREVGAAVQELVASTVAGAPK